MSRWQANFDSQQAVQKVQGIQRIIETAQTDDLPPATLEELARLLKVLKIIEVKLSSLDPELFRYNSWGSFASWLDNTHNNVVQFNQNRNVGHLHNANNTLDEVLSIVRPASAAYSQDEIKALVEANAQFTQAIVQELELVKKRSQELKAHFDALMTAITEAKSRLSEHDKVIQEQKTRLDQSIAAFQKQFSDAQEKRTKDFAEALKKSESESHQQSKQFDAVLKEDIARRQQKYDTFFETARKENDTQLEFLRKRQEEVNKIFGVIGTTAFAGNFKTTADTEASAANLWRWIALGLMAVMIVVGGYAFYFSIGHETDWRVFAFRLGTVIVLAVPAIYAANESSKHRERERLNRKVHLELASIDAYLVLLPEDQRNKIKGSLAEKFFGLPVLQEKADELSQKDLFGVITAVVNNLTKGK